jgi:hypothetical protein
VPVRERVWLYLLGVRVRVLLLQVLLAARVVAHLLESGTPCCLLLSVLVLVARFLRVGAFLLNNELLARVGINLSHLVWVRLLLQLGLLLLVLLKALFALVGGQLAVRGALGHVGGRHRATALVRLGPDGSIFGQILIRT